MILIFFFVLCMRVRRHSSLQHGKGSYVSYFPPQDRTCLFPGTKPFSHLCHPLTPTGSSYANRLMSLKQFMRFIKGCDTQHTFVYFGFASYHHVFLSAVITAVPNATQRADTVQTRWAYFPGYLKKLGFSNNGILTETCVPVRI